jgi:Subtilase family/Carboxypeptidase regulatory-like domain/Repeat of unknown function (DUF6923)/PKD domain
MWRKLCSLTFAMVFVLSLLPGMAAAQAQPAAPAGSGKIDAQLVDLLSVKGTADFIVDLAEKADLSAAYKMTDWSARGRFVYDTLRAQAERTQAEAIKLLDGQGLKHQTFFAGNVLYVWGGNLEAANALAALPSVKLVRATQVYQLDPIESEATSPDAELAWGIADAKADQFWASFGLSGEGIVQANIDTGVDWTHEALEGNYKCAANPSSLDCWLDPGTADCSGVDGGPCDSWSPIYHGTHTMGTQAGSNDPALPYNVGMAPGSQWITCTGCPYGGCPDFDLNACSDWLLAPNGNPNNRPNVVNNSWGGGGGNAWYQPQVQSWVAAGIFPAFSAGNNYSCNSLGSPGDYQESFASAAHRSDRIIADFSSKGPSYFGDDPYTKPNISSPGENVWSAMPGDSYQYMSGTSMASPHTAGAVALLWSCNPSLIGDIDTTFQILQDNANTPPDGSCGAPPDLEGNYTYGYGYLDAYEAGLMWCGDTGTIQGHVYQSDGVTPIANATVFGDEVGDTGTFTAQTDAAGFYQRRVMVGTYDVTASKYAWLPETAYNVVISVDATTTQNFTLDPAPTSIVDGTVTDALTGWPLYARIDIDGYPEGPVWTDPETGYYSVSLADGTAYTFHVNAWSGGYIQADRTLPVLSGPRTEDFALDVDVAACNAPGYEPATSYLEDFEASNGGFTVDPASVNSTWAWGVPTSGPGSAYSGVNVWATNLSGTYPDNSDEILVSPDIDLSGLGGGFKLDWWQWLQTESCCDPAYVQVSNDGGANWNTVYQGQGDVDLSWGEHSVELDASYAVSNFRVRFYLHTDVSVYYDGWYIDDVAVLGECLPQDGGLVVGNVYDLNTSLPLNGATVSDDVGGSTTTVATPDDPNVDDGFYLMFVENLIAKGAANGVDSLTGSYVVLDPSVGGDTCYDNASAETFCFRAESFSPDYAYVYNVWERFPTDWTVNDVYVVGTPWCDNGSWGSFDWTFETSPYEVNINHPRYMGSGGAHCIAYYCFDVTTGATGGTALESWYWAGDDYGGPPKHPCSSDQYTPASQSDACDEWVNPQAAVPQCEETGVPHELTATKTGYSPDTETVNVPEWGVVVQDFYLGTGHLTFVPPNIHVTLDMGTSTTVNGTLSNDGSGAAMFEFMEQDRGFVPTGYIEYLPMPKAAGTDGAAHNGPLNLSATPRQPYIFHGNAPQAANIIVYCDDDHHAPTYVEMALQAAGLTYTFYGNPGDPGPLDLFTQAVNAGGWDLVILAQDSWIYLDAREYTAVANHIANGGTAIVYSWGIGYGSTQYGNGLWAAMGAQYQMWLNSPANLYWWEDSHPIFTSPESVPEFTQLNNLGYLAYGAKMALLGDPSTGLGGFTTDPAANEAGVILREDFKTLYRGLTDNLNNADLDGDGMADPEEWWINAVGFMLNPAVDVPWLSESPISGTLASGASTPVAVTFDAGVPEVTQPGDYLGTLRIKNDTPYGALQVPVTMTVIPPATYGKLEGHVYSLGYCDAEMIPLEGAVVVVTGSGGVWTLETDDTGYYQLWLDQSNTPVTIDVTYPGNEAGQATGVVIVGQQTTTVNFQLRWLQPCLSVAPLSMEVTQALGQQTTLPLTITNDGAGSATWEFMERDRGYSPTKIYIPASEGNVEHGNEPASIGRAPSVGVQLPSQPIPADIAAVLGAQAYAIDVYPGYNMVMFDTDTPGTWSIVAPVGGSTQYFGGDFLNYDFSQMYVVDYGTNTLYTLSTTDGSVTTIGPAVPGGGESWTGLAGAPDGTLYGSATTCGSSTLYEVDPATGTTTAIGTITNAPCIIDIAVNGDGDMYGVDIVNDNLIQIDPATGAGTVVGSLGFSANYAQGMDFDEESGVLFWAAYSSSGELRVIDTATGASSPVGGFPGGAEVDCLAIATGGGDIVWLSEDPTGGILAPDGGTVTADVTFDASVVTQPGKYFGTLTVSSDDPVNNKIAVPVTMTVSAPPTYGLLRGTVASLGYCDANPVPLEGATVVVQNSGIFTLTTDASGAYTVWLNQGTYNVDVSADDHTGASAVIQITGQQTTTQDFSLRWLEPCVSLTPPSMESWLTPGTSETQILTLFNNGAAPTPFEIEEVSGTVTLNGQAPAPAGNTSPRSGLALGKPVTPSRSATQGDCMVAITVGYDPEQQALRDTLDELGFPWIEIYSVQEARDAGAAVIMDHSPASTLPAYDLGLWMADGFGYIEQGDWPQYFPDTWLGAPSGTPLDIVVVDSSHPLARGLPSAWTGLGFWAYDWDQDAVGYVTDPSYPNVMQAGYYGSLNDRAVSYVEVGDDGRGVYLGVNVQGSLAGDYDKKLFENAIRWTGHCSVEDVPWVAEDPVTGTLQADSFFDVDVTFTAAPTMPLGTYTATLIVHTDDPVNGDINVPLLLHVVDCVEVVGVELSVSSPLPVYPGQAVDLLADIAPNTAAVPYDYVIDYGDGTAPVSGSSSDDPMALTHVFANAGTYLVSFSATNVCMTDPVVGTLEVVVSPAPLHYYYLPIIGKNY